MPKIFHTAIEQDLPSEDLLRLIEASYVRRLHTTGYTTQTDEEFKDLFLDDIDYIKANFPVHAWFVMRYVPNETVLKEVRSTGNATNAPIFGAMLIYPCKQPYKATPITVTKNGVDVQRDTSIPNFFASADEGTKDGTPHYSWMRNFQTEWESRGLDGHCSDKLAIADIVLYGEIPVCDYFTEVLKSKNYRLLQNYKETINGVETDAIEDADNATEGGLSWYPAIKWLQEYDVNSMIYEGVGSRALEFAAQEWDAKHTIGGVKRSENSELFNWPSQWWDTHGLSEGETPTSGAQNIFLNQEDDIVNHTDSEVRTFGL